MKTLFKSSLLLALATMVALASCKKEDVEPIINPTDPGPTVSNPTNDVLFSGNTITASISGMVEDEFNNPVPNALVTIGNQTEYTNQLGLFSMDNVTVDENRAYIKVEKAGYFLGSRSINPNDQNGAYVEIKLLTKTISGSVDNATGGAVNVSGGPVITFGAGDISLENGSAYTGTVNVAATYLDPTDPDIGAIMPGDLQAVDNSGSPVVLETFGMVAVELTGANGEALNVAPGQTVQITMPVPATILGSAPSTIPLWYFDETDGNWVEEGSATLQGNEYVGEVSHFSFWNCDRPYGGTGFSMRVVCNGTPNANAKVVMHSPTGTMYGISYTNGNGEMDEMMPAEVEVIMDIYDVCNNIVYTQNLGTNYSPLALGDVNVCLGVNSSAITGTVTDCNGDPVSNGLFNVVAGGNNISLFADNNGQVDAVISTCSLDSVLVTAYDLDQNMQSASIFVYTGTTIDLGNMSTCSQIDEYFTFTLDGNTTYYQELGQNEVNCTGSQDSLAIMGSDGTNVIGLTVFGGTTGSFNNSQVIILDQTNFLFSDSPSLIVTDINVCGTGAGSYVEGTFSGTFTSGSATQHTISGQFRARRDN